MNRRNVWAKRVCQAGLAVVVAAAPFIAAPIGWTSATNVAWAAEKQQALSEQEAQAKATQWVPVPEGYKLRSSRLLDMGDGASSWIFVWEQRNEGVFLVEVDANSGELIRYYLEEQPSQPSGARLVDEKGAEAAARQFLQRVEAEKLDELSEPNQFVRQPARVRDQYSFVFTRMVNNVPFLENGMYVTVDKWGRVISYFRDWWTQALPEAEPAFTLEEAEETLKQALQPSLAYVNLDKLLSVPYTSLGYRAVYHYDEGDAYALDAVSGEVLTRTGDKAAEKAEIRPLGSTVRSVPVAAARITVEEAQAIADQLAKRIPGSYRSEGQGGSSVSYGPDGVQRHWSFDYLPSDSPRTKETGFVLSISDRGELVEYTSLAHQDLLFHKKPTEKPVSLAKAEEAAVAFIKRMLPDRLGELYLKPLAEKEREALVEEAKQRGTYEIPFGWMKGGIPLEDGRVMVAVEAETGEVIEFRDRTWDGELTRLDVPEKLIDSQAALETETKQKQLMLTYFLPQVVWKAAQDELPPREVRLVYRYVGSEGVVDAETGAWLDQQTLLENSLPRDIDGHPQEEAILNALKQRLLTVTDGRFEPDKPLTRGELAFIISQAVYDMPIFTSYRRALYEDENGAVYRLTDVPASHPQYQAIQNAIAMGLLSASGSRFEPERPVTRLEVAQVVAKLLGYGDLLGKPELFASPFTDIAKAEAPAAVLADSFGLVPAIQPGQFAPNETFTRAEAAQLFQLLTELSQQRK